MKIEHSILHLSSDYMLQETMPLFACLLTRDRTLLSFGLTVSPSDYDESYRRRHIASSNPPKHRVYYMRDDDPGKMMMQHRC